LNPSRLHDALSSRRTSAKLIHFYGQSDPNVGTTLCFGQVSTRGFRGDRRHLGGAKQKKVESSIQRCFSAVGSFRFSERWGEDSLNTYLSPRLLGFQMFEDIGINDTKSETVQPSSTWTLKNLGVAAATMMFVSIAIFLAFATKLKGPEIFMANEAALLAIAVTALMGLAALIGNVVIASEVRIAASLLLVAALVFAFAQPLILVVSIAIDRFWIFSLGYQLTFSICLPLLGSLLVFQLQWFGRCLGWLGTLGFVIWVLCLGLLHLGVVIQISYSV
jgi:hypothetical protein